jgi:hypothetical protein
MGECGCGEMNIIDNVFVGDKVLAVDLYRGCRYCGADIGIKLHIFTKKEAKHWDIEPQDKLEINEWSENYRNVFWIGMEHFIKAILNYKNEIPEYNALEDFLEDRKHDILKDALKLAKNQWDKNSQ